MEWCDELWSPLSLSVIAREFRPAERTVAIYNYTCSALARARDCHIGFLR